MAYNTGNPLGSKDPRDLYDNATNFDNYSVGSNPMYTDRFGAQKLSIEGQQQAFQSAQEGREAQFETTIAGIGFTWLGDYGAGLTFTTRQQYTVRGGLAYSVDNSTTLPFTLTGTWATDQPKLKLVNSDQILRSDLAVSTGATLVGTPTGSVQSVLNAHGVSITEAQADIAELQSRVTEVSAQILPLGDAVYMFQYHYEHLPDSSGLRADVDKLQRLKSYGFNVLWIYQGSPWMNNISRSLAWLDTIHEFGIYAVFQAEWSLLVASVDAPSTASAAHLAWIDAVTGHPALLGWTGVDEPVGVSFPVASQIKVASVLRAHSKKRLFLVDAATSLNALDTYYRSDVRDVYLLDVYAPAYTDEGTFKLQFCRPILDMLCYGGHGDAGKISPSQIILVTQCFGATGFPLPSDNQAKWAIEAASAFGNGITRGSFAHDVSDPDYTTFDSDNASGQALRDQAAMAMTTWGNKIGHGYSLINAVGYQTSPYFLEATNITRTQYNTHFLLTSAATGDYSIGIKHEVAPGTKFVILFAKVINGVDATTRTVALEINDSGSWVVAQTQTFGAATGSADLMFAYPVNANARSIGFRVRVVNAAAPAGAVGIMAMAAVNC